MTSRGREKRRESEIEIGSRRRRLCDKSERPPYLHFRTGSRPLISDALCDDVRGKPGCRPKRAPLRRYEVSVLPSHLPPHPHSQPTLPSPHSRADRVPCQQHPTPDLTGGEGSSGAPGFDPPPPNAEAWCGAGFDVTPVGMQARDPVYRGVMALASGSRRTALASPC